jgi:hypothetical protein
MQARDLAGKFASSTPIADRFWAFIPRRRRGKCWPWEGARNARGYGMFQLRTSHTVRANRMAWMLANGDPGPLLVLHKCDNPACCNPDHLFIGTHRDNSDDKVSKGRQARGTGHGRAILTFALAQRIRRDRAVGARQTTLAERYGVSRSTIRQILDGITWKAP